MDSPKCANIVYLGYSALQLKWVLVFAFQITAICSYVLRRNRAYGLLHMTAALVFDLWLKSFGLLNECTRHLPVSYWWYYVVWFPLSCFLVLFVLFFVRDFRRARGLPIRRRLRFAVRGVETDLIFLEPTEAARV